MKLFLFHDDVERILVAAADPTDAFKVVEEEWGAEAADALIMSDLREEGPTETSRGLIAHIVR